MLLTSLLPILLILGGIGAEEPIERVCPPGVVTSADRSKCFFIVPVPLSFEDAQKTCANLNLRLASIETEADNDHLSETVFDRFRDLKMQNGDFWLGGTLLSSSWKWMDGSALTFSNWADGQPSGSGNCLYVNSTSGLWFAGNCGEKSSYVCESDVVVTPAPTCPPPSETSTTTTTTSTETSPSSSTKSSPASEPSLSPSTSTSSTSAATPTSTLPTPVHGWNPFGNHMYYLNSEQKNWNDARSWCSSQGAELVSIHSKQENDFLFSLSGGWTWIGGFSPADNNTFIWSDGSVWNYTNWTGDDDDDDGDYGDYGDEGDGDDNLPGYGCILFTSTKTWTSAMCESIDRFVCKKKFDSSEVVTATSTTPSSTTTTTEALTPSTSASSTFSSSSTSSSSTTSFSSSTSSSLSTTSSPHISSTTPSPVTSSAPTEWRSFRGHLYYFNSEHKNWTDARSWCVSEGADLVSIHSKKENKFVSKMWKHQGDTWIGGHSPTADTTYVWSDGSDWDFNDWTFGEPSNTNGGDKCVSSHMKKKWTTNQCDNLYPFICEKSAQ
ncbi:hypothetical protein QR680_004488 [Steinernema hermaphroditum]|uniref:C-type lectin domain-containing protein n=1 Tax=Steinernema hermaphroditum TaxID=289476 RepID=A0AA39LTS9_9BILA|nr:hypothetical protein QR680_004488 [Steinernema hermaphroditum]